MPVFVSNRDPSVRDLTVHALVLAGCGSEEQIRPNLYLSGGEIGKTDNFVLVNSRYQVVAWIGDNLADCDSRFEAPAGLDVDRRKALVAELADTDKIGNGYFLLPNPVYGEWSTLVDWQTPLRYFDH